MCTTADLLVAKAFAGRDGIILEMYPSFGKAGINVSWLSSFPDEDQIFYMNTSFEIAHILPGESELMRPLSINTGNDENDNEDIDDD